MLDNFTKAPADK